MKILKLLFVFALVSTLAVSCKESKKEEVTEDAAVEVTEESVEATEEVVEAPASAEASDDESENNAAAAAGAAGAAAAATSAEEETEVVEEVESETKEVVPAAVPVAEIKEELADTPVIYPGCTGSTTDEIRACNKESFIAYVKKEFNHDVANEAGLKRGDYKIQITMHVNKSGRVFASRVVAPHDNLKNETMRVVNSTPKVTPATHAGEPVVVSMQFVVDFKVESTQ